MKFQRFTDFTGNYWMRSLLLMPGILSGWIAANAVPVDVYRGEDGVRVRLETETQREYALEVSDDMVNWRSVDKVDGTGAAVEYGLEAEGTELFVRFAILSEGELRGPVNLPIQRGSGFSESAADLAEQMADKGIGNTDDLFRRMGSVYQINSEVKRLRDAGVGVDSGALLHLLREAEIRTNMQPLEQQGFRRELTDRLVRSRIILGDLHARMQQLMPDHQSQAGGLLAPQSGTGPSQLQLRDHYVDLRNTLVEVGPIDFSFEEFLQLRDHIAALEPLEPGVLRTSVQSSHLGTGLRPDEPNLAQQEMTLDKEPPPSTAYVPELIRERLIRSLIYPDLPITILGAQKVSDNPPLYQRMPAQPPVTEDREDGYRHFMVNEVGLAWFTLYVGGTGRRLQIDSPDGVRVIDVELQNQGSYGFLLPIFEADKGRYWRVADHNGLTLRLVEISSPLTIATDSEMVFIPDLPLPVPYRDNGFSGTWLRFRTHHDAPATGWESALSLQLFPDDAVASGSDGGADPQSESLRWQALLLADRQVQESRMADYDAVVEMPIENRTGTYDLFVLPNADAGSAWAFDEAGKLTAINLFPVDWARCHLPRPRMDLEIYMHQVKTRAFAIGLIDQVAFSRDGESDGNKAEVKLTFNANIAPYFPEVDAFSAAVGEPMILEAWKLWSSMGGSASAVRASAHRIPFEQGVDLLRSHSEFYAFFQKATLYRDDLRRLWHNDDVLLLIFSRYLNEKLGSSWYRAIDEAEALYANWMDTVVQINSFNFPYDQYYNIIDSHGVTYYEPQTRKWKTDWWYYHPVIPVNVPLFAMPKDRLATEVRPIQASYFGIEIDEINGWAIFGAVLRGVVNAALSIVSGNWAGAVCDGINMIAGIQKVLADAEDDPIGSANFTLTRASSDHGFFGFNDDQLVSFQMSGYPDGNNEHFLSGPMQFAQLSCSVMSLVSATGGPLVSNPIANTQQFWQRIQAGQITDIVEQIQTISQAIDSMTEIAELAEFSAKLLEGDLQGALEMAADWTQFGAYLQEGQDLFDSFSQLQDNRPFMGGAASLGYNLSHSEIYFHFGNYSNRKTSAQTRVGLVRSVPASSIEVHFTEAKIFDIKESVANLPAEIFVKARVGVVADKGPQSWRDVPLQHVGPDGQLLLENGSISSGYQTLPNLPFVAYTRKVYPVVKFGHYFGSMPTDVVYTPQPGDTPIFNATWSEDVNTAAIYIEIGVYEDDGPRLDDDMIGIYSRTLMLEDLLKDPDSGWEQQEDGSWLLLVQDYPVYDELNLETLVRITDDEQAEFQRQHNARRLLNPSAMISFSVRIELADFVTWQDDFDYDIRPDFEVEDLDELSPRVVASSDDAINQILDQQAGRVLTQYKAQRTDPHTLQIWQVSTAEQPALELLATLSVESLPGVPQNVFKDYLYAQFARNGDFVVILHYDGLTAVDLRDPASLSATHYGGLTDLWPTRMVVDANGDIIYLSFRHADFDIAALHIDEDGEFSVLASNHQLPDTVVGLLALPQGGVLVHLMNKVRLPQQSENQRLSWGLGGDEIGFLLDEDIVFDDKPIRTRSSLRTMDLRESAGVQTLQTIHMLDLKGNVSGEQLSAVIHPHRSSIFKRFDNQTFVATHSFAELGFAVQVDPDLFFMDPARINSTREVFKEVLDVRKASIGWGYWAGSSPTTLKKVGEHWINQMIGTTHARYIFNERLYPQLHPSGVYAAFRNAESPLSPFNVFTAGATEAAFCKDAILVGSEIFPLGDSANRYVLVRGADDPNAALNLPTRHRLRLGPQQPGLLMLVDLWAADPLNPTPEGMVRIDGGNLPAAQTPGGPSALGPISVESYFMGQYEVTLGEWQTVRTWAVNHGYPELDGVGIGCSSIHPVTEISWYDVLKWCNAQSELLGLVPAYYLDGEVYRSGNLDWYESDRIQWNAAANGVRLPTEREWEFAARGGNLSNEFVFSGSNDLDTVGWYHSNVEAATCENLGLYTHPVGLKMPNELGLYDMSGNLLEMVWDRGEFYDNEPFDSGYTVRKRGGAALYPESMCTVAFRDDGNANQRWTLHGFRTVRNLPDHPLRSLQITADLDFGEVEIERSVSRTVLIENNGEGPLTVVDIRLPAGFSSSFTAGAINAGEHVAITVSFNPTVVKDYFGWMDVLTNVVNGEYRIAIEAAGVPQTEPPFAAWAIHPFDFAINVDRTAGLTIEWSAGWNELRPAHYSLLYFSTDINAVNQRNSAALVQGDGSVLHESWTSDHDLLPGTAYHWLVVIGNASGETPSELFTFTTASPVTDFPYSEDFDSWPVPPESWRNLYNESGLDGVGFMDSIGGGWMMGSEQYVHSGAGSATMYPWVMPGWYWMITPEMVLPDAPETLFLRFDVFYEYTEAEPTELFLLLRVGDAWQQLNSWTGQADINRFDERVEVDLSAYAGQSVTLAFVYNANAFGSAVAIDAFSVGP